MILLYALEKKRIRKTCLIPFLNMNFTNLKFIDTQDLINYRKDNVKIKLIMYIVSVRKLNILGLYGIYF
eukprot:UN27198